MSKDLGSFLGRIQGTSLSQSFVRDFSLEDIALFQNKYKGLTSVLKTSNISDEARDLMDDLVCLDPKNEIILTMCLAKYSSPNDPLKKMAIERLKFFVDNSESQLDVPVDIRNHLIDGIIDFLPVSNPAYKELHAHIRAWDVGQSSWKHAREDAGHDL
ncbi:MAG: hypothetical protein ACRBDI_00125 [Alphaproteobacteria bacterium]